MIVDQPTAIAGDPLLRFGKPEIFGELSRSFSQVNSRNDRWIRHGNNIRPSQAADRPVPSIPIRCWAIVQSETESGPRACTRVFARDGQHIPLLVVEQHRRLRGVENDLI